MVQRAVHIENIHGFALLNLLMMRAGSKYSPSLVNVSGFKMAAYFDLLVSLILSVSISVALRLGKKMVVVRNRVSFRQVHTQW